MPERYLDENRFLYLESGLGPNQLLLESFTGVEGISRLFSFQLELLSEDPRIRFERVLGQEIAFGVSGPDGSAARSVHGLVTSFTQLPGTPRLSRYRAVVSPKPWVLTRKLNSRIFQGLSVPDILATVMRGLDVGWELGRTYAPRDYCVQYRETDFNFVSRLMEEEGIFYFFRHTRNSHKMVMADSPAAHRDMPGGRSLLYEEVSGGLREEGRVSGWVKTQELGPGKHTLTDYCYGTPATDMRVNQNVVPSVQVGRVSHRLKVGGNEDFEIYDFPGRYGIRAQEGGNSPKSLGEHFVRIGIEQMEVAQFSIQGESNIFRLIPGFRFGLARHPHAEGDYVLTSVTHSASEGGFHSAAEIGQDHYSNLFECIPIELHYRPARTASKPYARGCQTAVVVGPPGEEIYTDDQGRIKVQFHWDREGRKDASSSCWVRVASFWAGRSWGAIHLPRIGHEVVVDFLEGDPDCPIVVGSVYNGQNPPPYSLPDNKTQSGILSRSSTGGGAANFNQIRFEDKKGSEEIQVHAEKDMNTVVENDETRHVMHDRTTTIDHDQKLTVKNDRSAEIQHDDFLVVKNDRTTTIKNNESHKVHNNRATAIQVDDTADVGRNLTLTVGLNRDTQVKLNDSTKVGGSRSTTITGSESVTAMSRSVTLAGGDSVTSGGSITITATGITITAPTITLATAMLQVAGVVQCTSVVSPTYTPGAGNIF